MVSMECKMYGIHKENEGLRWMDSAGSQKMDLKWWSVWSAKCKEFFWKSKDSVANAGVGKFQCLSNGAIQSLGFTSLWMAKM